MQGSIPDTQEQIIATLQLQLKIAMELNDQLHQRNGSLEHQNDLLRNNLTSVNESNALAREQNSLLMQILQNNAGILAPVSSTPSSDLNGNADGDEEKEAKEEYKDTSDEDNITECSVNSPPKDIAAWVSVTEDQTASQFISQLIEQNEERNVYNLILEILTQLDPEHFIKMIDPIIQHIEKICSPNGVMLHLSEKTTRFRKILKQLCKDSALDNEIISGFVNTFYEKFYLHNPETINDVMTTSNNPIEADCLLASAQHYSNVNIDSVMHLMRITNTTVMQHYTLLSSKMRTYEDAIRILNPLTDTQIIEVLENNTFFNKFCRLTYSEDSVANINNIINFCQILSRSTPKQRRRYIPQIDNQLDNHDSTKFERYNDEVRKRIRPKKVTRSALIVHNYLLNNNEKYTKKNAPVWMLCSRRWLLELFYGPKGGINQLSIYIKSLDNPFEFLSYLLDAQQLKTDSYHKSLLIRILREIIQSLKPKDQFKYLVPFIGDLEDYFPEVISTISEQHILPFFMHLGDQPHGTPSPIYNPSKIDRLDCSMSIKTQIHLGFQLFERLKDEEAGAEFEQKFEFTNYSKNTENPRHTLTLLATDIYTLLQDSFEADQIKELSHSQQECMNRLWATVCPPENTTITEAKASPAESSQEEKPEEIEIEEAQSFDPYTDVNEIITDLQNAFINPDLAPQSGFRLFSKPKTLDPKTSETLLVVAYSIYRLNPNTEELATAPQLVTREQQEADKNAAASAPAAAPASATGSVVSMYPQQPPPGTGKPPSAPPSPEA